MNKDKIVIDVGVGRIIEEWLSLHYEIVSIRKLNYEMEDLDILKLANEEGALIITMDKILASSFINIFHSITDLIIAVGRRSCRRKTIRYSKYFFKQLFQD